LKEINWVLEEKLGFARRGVLSGWLVYWVTQRRRAYSVEAMTIRYIAAERTGITDRAA
jgi:hypothetical protein